MGETAAVVEQAKQPEQHDESLDLSPYGYPEFSGPGGARYLKKVLRQILPMALYRTWEIFADHQARGNDCFLSIPQVAVLAGRSLRTMQKNIASLQAKKLLVERAERKSFRGSDGHVTSRMVVIKDFTALYDLAHEYHEWLQAEDLIPPERAFTPLIFQQSALVAKLRRFENYRRLLYNHTPGPDHRAQERDRWFTEYQPGTTMEAMVDHPLTQAQSSSQPSFLPKMTATKPSKEVSKESPKRISESSHRDGLHGASFDSASSLSEKPEKEKDDHAHQITRDNGGKVHEPASEIISHQSASQWQLAQQKQAQDHYHAPAGMTQRGASQAGRTMREGKRRASQRQAHLPWPSQARKGSAMLPPPPDHLLVRSFLNEIAVPFGDRNPKGSTTRILNILAQASLNETEVLLCLVRAYTIARDTRTIRSAHVEPGTGRANRMPLFCTLFERFVQARLHNDRWNYSWQQLEDDIAADDRLCSWWTERQVLCDPQTLNLPGSQTEAGAIAQEEPDEERENDLDIGGWVHREAAHYWGEQLLEALIAGGYEAEVYVHLEGQRYQLLLAGDGGEWLLSTPKMVQDVIKKMKDVSPQVARYRSGARDTPGAAGPDARHAPLAQRG